jgi:DNA-directed RNA polymerase specialized sigma24 family protein
MASDDGGVLHDFVRSRYPDLRRSAFLMCGDWALADELTQAVLARYLAETARRDVEDPDAYVYADLMAAFRGRPQRRERVFVAPDPGTPAHPAPDPDDGPPAHPAPDPDDGPPAHPAPDPGDDGPPAHPGGGDPARAVLVLDALGRLSSRCRAVMVLRHWNGFAVDETADVLGLTDERAAAYEAAGLAALGGLPAPVEPAVGR